MKLFLQCAKCLEIYLKNSLDTLDFPRICKVPLNDSSIYSTGCDIHDRQDVYCTTPKFEMIFQNGLSSIIDGYYRESVNSFASSLELFYEYYIHVLAAHLNRDPEKLSKAWRNLANSSERQLGAYTMSYFLTHNEPPPQLPEAKRALRNKVVHKGFVPDLDDAISFGNAILDVIRPVLEQARKENREAMDNIQRDSLKCKTLGRSDRSRKVPVASFHIAFGPSYQTPLKCKNVEEMLESLRAYIVGLEQLNRLNSNLISEAKN